MAKVTVTIEDAVKDDQKQVLGQFKTEGQNPPDADGLPGEVTPAELYTVCFQRLWDAGLMNGFVTLVCADLLFRNDQVRQRRAAAQAAKAVPNLPEGLPQLAKPETEDAVVIQPDAPEAPPAATIAALADAPHPDECVVPLPEGVPTHLPDGTPVRVAAGSGDAKGLAW